MDFSKLQSLLERKLTKCEIDKKEEIAQAIEKKQPNIDMSKKMAIATAAAKKSCSEAVSKETVKKEQEKELSDAEKAYLKQLKESEDLNEVSNYDKVVVYYRSLGMNPYALKGEIGKQLRQKIKQSPAFKAWAKQRKYEEVEETLTEETHKDVVRKLKGMGFIPRRDERPHNKLRGTNHAIYILPHLEHPENSIAVPRHAGDLHPHLVRGIYKLANKLLTARQLNNKLVEDNEKESTEKDSYEKESKADKVIKAKKKKDEHIKFYYDQQDYKKDDNDFDPALTAQGNK